MDNLYGDDPHFDNVILLMPMDGPQDGVVFKDHSRNNFPITVNGVGKLDRVKVKYGLSSAYLDASSDYVYILNDARLDIGTSLFTIECWVYIIAHRGGTKYSHIIARANTNSQNISTNLRWAFNFKPTGEPDFNYVNSSGTWLNCGPSSPSAITTGLWHHLAVVRIGSGANDVKLFVDGVLAASSTANASLDARTAISPPLLIGGGDEYAYAGSINGYIDDVRITRDVARYLTDFTPPCGPHSLR